MAEQYEPARFEEGWVSRWESDRIYAAPDSPDPGKKKFVMEMFPYPSGDLHMGHVENYSIADTMARYWRMKGLEVMHPMGYDAFGLPSERAAIERGIHPREWTMSNISRMRSSFRRTGYSYDWERELISCEPSYYQWNQWIFLKFFERGLAYRESSPVNWCPVDKTVLAREQLSTGVCWRCGSAPEIRDLTQWFLKITDYSDRLLDDMDQLDWPSSILSQQRHWIGRSRGAEVAFRIKPDSGDEFDVDVFTTRPDTLWGATFFVFAPEHPDAARLVEETSQKDEFSSFVEEVKKTLEVDRLAGTADPMSFRLPAVAVNPVSGEEIPVYAADYVLMGYGTGAIMAVPAHDQRDFDFAKRHDLAVRVVVQPDGATIDVADMTEASPARGSMIASGPFDGTKVDPETFEGIEKVVDWLATQGKGKAQVNYRQRDWLVSRQRYWGTPIPIIHCPECGEVPVPYEQLPVLLPDMPDYAPSDDAVSPLENVAEWVEVNCPNCGGSARRDTDTLDTFFDSSWYFLRYCDPSNTQMPFDPDLVKNWCPVDMYVGGTEHVVMHLIYARFFIKAFKDMGLVTFDEPFLKLFNQGSVSMGGEEMSSSKGNAIDASAVLDKYGADTARLFMLFSGPPQDPYDFPAEGGMELIGQVANSWLSRVWRVLSEVADEVPGDELATALARTTKAVTDDMEGFGFNTATARLMELVNDFYKLGSKVPKEAAETFLKLLAPMAPFITEELWHRYGNETSIHVEPWPSYEQSLIDQQTVTMVVQVNGKVRDRIEVASSINEEEMRTAALSSEKAVVHLAGREPSRVIVRPPRLINLVVS